MQPTDVLVEYETASIEPIDAAHNNAWLLHADGRVFVKQNPAGAIRPRGTEDPYWFAEPYPEQPVQIATPATVARIRGLLDAQAGLEPIRYQATEGLEGGAVSRLRIQSRAGRRDIEVDSPREGVINAIIRPILAALREDI